MKTLAEIYQQEGAAFLTHLHQQTGVSKKYIYHMSRGARRPSPEMALRLVQADRRLSFIRLILPEVKAWPDDVVYPLIMADEETGKENLSNER